MSDDKLQALQALLARGREELGERRNEEDAATAANAQLKAERWMRLRAAVRASEIGQILPESLMALPEQPPPDFAPGAPWQLVTRPFAAGTLTQEWVPHNGSWLPGGGGYCVQTQFEPETTPNRMWLGPRACARASEDSLAIALALAEEAAASYKAAYEAMTADLPPWNLKAPGAPTAAMLEREGWAAVAAGRLPISPASPRAKGNIQTAHEEAAEDDLA